MALTTAERELVGQIEAVLEDRRHVIDQEVSDYPRPITACDVQFEHALDEQAGIRRELARARALYDCDRGQQEFIQAIGEFVASCAYITAEGEQQIRSSLADLETTPT
ncbi:MAG: hypothetical protein OET44_15485 [Gammaproteobacteria bacterium]|nr:hypothetical protein [Gammaproteobacteria bacterium]